MYHFNSEDFMALGIQGIWLSYYAKEWSQPHNAAFSIARGLHIRSKDSDPYAFGTYRRFSQLDGSAFFLTVNQFLKYVKFGFGQATDHACYDIRDGLISRDEGIFLVRELDGGCAPSFIEEFCRYIDISTAEFWIHVNKFRGNMWVEEFGNWRLADPIWEQSPIKGAREEGQYSVAAIQSQLGYAFKI
jgi:hypothetical protein